MNKLKSILNVIMFRLKHNHYFNIIYSDSWKRLVITILFVTISFYRDGFILTFTQLKDLFKRVRHIAFCVEWIYSDRNFTVYKY